MSGSAPKVTGVYSGPRPILQPSFMEINKPTNKQMDTGEGIPPLTEVITMLVQALQLQRHRTTSPIPQFPLEWLNCLIFARTIVARDCSEICSHDIQQYSNSSHKDSFFFHVEEVYSNNE